MRCIHRLFVLGVVAGLFFSTLTPVVEAIQIKTALNHATSVIGNLFITPGGEEPNGSNEIIILNQTGIQTSGHVVPMQDNATDIGSSLKRFRKIYSHDIYNSGDIFTDELHANTIQTSFLTATNAEIVDTLTTSTIHTDEFSTTTATVTELDTETITTQQLIFSGDDTGFQLSGNEGDTFYLHSGKLTTHGNLQHFPAGEGIIINNTSLNMKDNGTTTLHISPQGDLTVGGSISYATGNDGNTYRVESGKIVPSTLLQNLGDKILVKGVPFVVKDTSSNTNFQVMDNGNTTIQGQVGIGIDNPYGGGLHVHGSDYDQAKVTLSRDYNGYGPTMEFVAQDDEPLSSYRPLGVLQFLGSTDSTADNNYRGASIQATSTQSRDTTKGGTKLEFRTTTNDTINRSTKMTINHNGNVGIGTSHPQQKLEIVGNLLAQGTVESNTLLTYGDAHIKGGISKRYRNHNVPMEELQIGVTTGEALIQSTNGADLYLNKRVTGNIIMSSPTTFQKPFTATQDSNVEGVLTVDGFRLPQGADTGKVLTTDASGNAYREDNISDAILPPGNTGNFLIYQGDQWVSTDNISFSLTDTYYVLGKNIDSDLSWSPSGIDQCSCDLDNDNSDCQIGEQVDSNTDMKCYDNSIHGGGGSIHLVYEIIEVLPEEVLKVQENAKIFGETYTNKGVVLGCDNECNGGLVGKMIYDLGPDGQQQCLFVCDGSSRVEIYGTSDCDPNDVCSNYQSCSATTQDGFNLSSAIHNQTQQVTKDSADGHGRIRAKYRCDDGDFVQVVSEYLSSCEAGYAQCSQAAYACPYDDQCLGVGSRGTYSPAGNINVYDCTNLPTNAYRTSPAQRISSNGGANDCVWTCKNDYFDKDNNKTTNADGADDCEGTNATHCGDGIVQSPNSNGDYEQCDDGASNSDSTPNACRTNCKNPICGDGVRDTGEQCDDGNTNPNDGCLSCNIRKTCGDGIVYNEAGGTEECDRGDNTFGGGNGGGENGCGPTCKRNGTLANITESTSTENLPLFGKDRCVFDSNEERIRGIGCHDKVGPMGKEVRCSFYTSYLHFCNVLDALGTRKAKIYEDRN